MAAYKKKKKEEKSEAAGSNKSTPLPAGASSVVTDDEHAKLVKWVNESDDATIDTRELAEKSRSYYDTTGQWTAAERRKLAAQKQAATTINRVKPKIDSLMGMERANRTTAKAMPRTPKETAGATAATEATRYCLQSNMFERTRSDTWENMLIEGSGGIEIIVKPKGDTYDVVLRHIFWDRLIYDAHSRRKDFTDARFLGQVVWMDYDEAVDKYPAAKDILETMQSTSSTYDDRPRWMDAGRRRVKIVEMYYKHSDGDWWYACFTRGGYCEAPKKSPYVNDVGETEHAYEFASLFVDRDGGRYGAMKQLLDVQDEINKRRSKALHLLSVRQTFGTAGAVADINKARAELAKPDGHVEFAYGELNKDFGVLPTGDMANGQFQLLNEAKMEIDAVGANSATMGKDRTVQSGVALRQRALTGQTELAPMFDMLKNLDIRVYKKVWNRIKQYWKSEMWLRVTDDENNLKFVGLNKPVTKGEQILKTAQEKGAPPEALAQLEAQIAADPSMQQVVDTSNDIVKMDVDIIMDDAPDTVTQEVEDFQAMAEMVKSGFPIPPEAVIMSSPLSNKDKILKMMKERPQIPPQAQKQMEQQQEALQKAGEELQSVKQENQALKIDQSSEIAKINAKAESDRLDREAKQNQAQMDRQNESAAQSEKQRLAREQFEFDRQLEIDKANHEIDLEERKAFAAHKQKEDELKFDQECRVKDEAAKRDEQVKTEEVAVVPNVMKALEQITQTFSKALEAQTQALLLLAKAENKDKKITLDGIQRGEDGMLIGASATVQ